MAWGITSGMSSGSGASLFRRGTTPYAHMKAQNRLFPLAYCRSQQHCTSSNSETRTKGNSSSAERAPCRPPSTLSSQQAAWAAAASVGLLALPLLLAEPALALPLHPEPANALSLPTWAVHTSSVLEWTAAMTLIWQYAEVSGVPQWKGLTWAMLPCFFSAMCACTWHFFYNDTSELQFLVVVQAATTVLGNFCCWLAAYRIYKATQQKA